MGGVCASQPLSDEVDRFLVRYRDLNSAVVHSQYKDLNVRRESVIGADGRFRILHWRTKADESEKVFGIVAYDGQLMQTHEGLSDYQEFTPDPVYMTFPGPINRWDAPWIWVPTVIKEIRQSKDAVIEQYGYGFRMSSQRARWLLEWDKQQRLTRIRRGFAEVPKTTLQPCFDIQLSVFDPARTSAGVQWPSEMEVEFLINTDPADQNPVINLRLTDVQFNIENYDHTVLLDPAATGSHRVDSVSGDVFGPDGEYLYNKSEYTASFDRAHGLKNKIRKWWVLLALAIVSLSGVLAVRRIRNGTPL